MHAYLINGLVIHSEFKLVGAIKTIQPADFVVSFGVAPKRLKGNVSPKLLVEADEQGQFLVIFPQIARFFIGVNKHVIIEVEKGVSVETISFYFVSFVLQILSVISGGLTLYGGAIEKKGKAVLCLGQSAGVSTLLAKLSEHGFRLIATELFRVSFQSNKLLAFPGFPGVKLHDPSLKLLKKQACLLGPFNQIGIYKAGYFCNEPIEVRDICFIESGRNLNCSIHKIGGEEKLRMLNQNGKHLWINKLLSRAAKVSMNKFEIASRIKAHRFEYSMDNVGFNDASDKLKEFLLSNE